MAKITIVQLQTSDSYINEVSNTELDATKGGDAIIGNNIGNNIGSGNNINIGSGGAGNRSGYGYGYGGYWYY
jgi:hypothetical protein